MNLHLIAQLVLSLPKTLYFNFRQLPLKQAVKLPILVSYRVRYKTGGIVHQ